MNQRTCFFFKLFHITQITNNDNNNKQQANFHNKSKSTGGKNDFYSPSQISSCTRCLIT